jgi:hypothetical protein
MPARWVRILVGAIAAVATVVIGVLVTGTFDATPDPATRVTPGANSFMLILAIGLLVGFVAYGAAEWAQTRRLDSIASQFDTRTIVLIPIAIAINIVLGQTVGQALKIPVYLDSIGTILVGVLAGPIPGALTGLLANLIWTFVLAGTPFSSPYAWPYAIVAAEIGLLAGVFGYLGFFRPRPNTPPTQLVTGIVVALVVLGGLAWYGILPYYKDLGGFQFFGPTGQVDTTFIVLGYVIAAVLFLTVVGLLVRLFQKRDLGVAYVLVGGAICGVISAFISAPITRMLGGVTGSGTDFLVAAFQQAGSDLQTAVLQQGLISDPIDKTITYVVVFILLGALSRRFTARFPQGERAVGALEA